MIKFFLGKKVLVNLITVFIVLAGIAVLKNIKRASYPNVEFDILKITTTYPGASPEDVEVNVTKKIEDELAQLSDIDRYQANSMENLSIIYVWIDSNADDPGAVKDEIRRAVDRVADLPKEVTEKPQIQELKSSNVAVLEVAITGDASEDVLRKITKDFEDKIHEIKGVSTVEKVGYRKPEVKIMVDVSKLDQSYVSLNEIIVAIQNRNIRESGGTLESFTDQKKIVTFSEFDDPLEVKDVIIRENFGGKQLKLSEVAQVKKTYEDYQVYPRTNQKRSINLLIRQQTGADIINISEAVNNLIIKQRESLPSGVEVSVVADFSRYTRSLLGLVINNAVIGFILVLLCLFVFLNHHVAFWTAAGIPLSFLGALLLFPAFNVDINFISLITLILVLGMLVDDAIVVAENISRHRAKGLSVHEAALIGVREVFWPVTTTVITTIIAFMSLAFMTGVSGKFIGQIPIVVVLTLGVSLLESVFILPSHITNSPAAKEKTLPWFEKVKNWYERLVRKMIKYRRYTLLSFGLFFVVALGLAVGIMDINLFPYDDIDLFYVIAELPEGSSLEQTSEKMIEVEKIVEDLPKEALVNYTTRIGHHDTDVYGVTAGLQNHWAMVSVYLKPAQERDETSEDIMKILDEKFKNLKGFSELRLDKFNDGPPIGRAITIRIVGDDDVLRRKYAKEIFSFIKAVDGTKSLEMDEKLGKKELLLKPNYPLMARLGVSSKDLANIIRVAYNGVVVTSITRDGEEIDFRVQLDPKQRGNIEVLKKLQVMNNQGKLIQIGSFVTLEPSQSYESLRHFNGRRSITVLGDVDDSIITSAKINKMVQDKYEAIFDNAPGISLIFGGEEKATQESMESFAVAFIFSLIAIYFVLVILFDSFVMPFIIVAVIPFGLAGAIFTFFVNGMPISFLGIIGCLGLIGVMVNDALVMLSHLDQLKDKHDTLSIDQLVKGCTDRLRPVLLTTVTTVAGLLPTIFGIGGYEPFVIPLVLALAGGLVFATPITLVLVPTLYSLYGDMCCLFKKSFKKKAST
jgi:multidrug efflux pump subunit AcrB